MTRSPREHAMTRRHALQVLTSAAAAVLAGCRRSSAPVVVEGDVPIEEFGADGQSTGVTRVPKVIKTDAEWSSQLSSDAFDVTRHAGTETPFSGQYWNLHDPGLYRCICCDTALFSSDTKFESGTGWPSFWQPLSDTNIETSQDWTLGLPRTAVACHRCDAHIGHVFDDGPPPTGLRYCLNSVALKFVKFA